MKKTFIFAAVIAVASMFASCEKEPTALELENLNGKITVAGFVTMRTWKEKDDMLQENAQSAVKNQKVDILYGTKDKDGNYSYQEFSATTNGEGYYTLELPVAVGQNVDRIKAQVKIFLEKATVAQYQDGTETKFMTTDAWYQALVTKDDQPAGQTTAIDLVLVPVELTSQANLKIPGVID
ncbi:MAG: hypothetical protein IJQ95_06490 [Paludibacteraceae bacterium]|nr:hypothetical protein [Paludibacteraceae bacterium]